MDTVQIPHKLQFLFKPMRFKVAYGGRGSAKSWSIARALVVKLTQGKYKWLCAREIQNSIEESVHSVIALQIEKLGLSEYWKVDNKKITCLLNGSEFIFCGLFRNVAKIKSMEDLDGIWVEEADNVTKASWKLVIPTIRKDAENDDYYPNELPTMETDDELTLDLKKGSEIWVSFNPKHEDDFTYEFFVKDPPKNCTSVEVNYMDNPWFPQVLRDEMEAEKARDRIAYEHIWLGRPVGTGGKLYPMWDDKIHIKEFDRKLLAEKANCFCAMDPHSHYYPFLTWIAIIPKNDRGKWPEDFYKHIYAEWPTFERLGGYYHDLRKKLLFTGTLADIAREVYARDGGEYGIKVIKRFIDSRYAKGSGSWNWSTSTLGIVELFAQEENGGLRFECPAEKIMDAQKDVLRKDLTYNKHLPLNIWNEPVLSVDPSCKNTIISLKNHRLEEDPKGDGSREKESEKYKEASDTLRINYAGLNDFRYKDPQPEEEEDWERYYAGSGGKDGWMR